MPIILQNGRRPCSGKRGSYSGATEGRILSDQRVRLATVPLGIWLTAFVAIGAGVYGLATWDQPNRGWILAIAVAALVSAPMIRLLPWERIVESRRRELVFVSWSLADIAFIGAAAALDCGSKSPFSLLLVLPLLFAALSFPLRETVLVAASTLVVFGWLAFGVGGGIPYSGLGAFAMLCITLISFWGSKTQSDRRRELARIAEALRASESTSRVQAQQQREVASFGQLALGGADTDALQAEAVRLVSRTLSVEIAGVLKLMPERGGLLISAAVGLPPEAVGKATLPGDSGSQSGYTLATGSPTIVVDWETEDRFERTPFLTELGLPTRSGAMMPIKGKGGPYGVFVVQSLNLREFTAEDVSFLQAIANILANAIERRVVEERNRHEALQDPLTALPNRSLFLDRLGHALAQARRRRASVAVLFLDLDQFKLVNDSLGHAAGDELLAAVAPRIEQAVRPSDTVARFGGDEFAVLAEDIASEHDAIRVAERIAAGLCQPFVLRRRQHFVSASIGISIGAGGETPGALMRDADAALYQAKERGRGGYEIFDEAMRSRVIDQMQTENDLRKALQRGELELHYQPIVSLGDGSVTMLEALLRWRHPVRGLIGPAAFISLAEESSLILPIGRWVLEQACREAAAWQQANPDSAPVGIAVNLSARELADPQLLRSIESAIELSGIDPFTLRLELTETTLFEDSDDTLRRLPALRNLGVRLVLDDFGTGFSSLGYLRRLPLSGFKLDRAFVEDLAPGSSDAAIVRAVTEMAGALGLDVCAEGIEAPDQLEAVRELGCSHAQGFHFSRPVPPAGIPGLLGGVMTAD